MDEKLWAVDEIPEKTPYPKILKLNRMNMLNGSFDSIINELNPICFLTDRDPSYYRNRRRLRTILQKYIPTIALSEKEPEY